MASKRKPRKQSGSKASTLAGQLLEAMQHSPPSALYIISTKDLKTLCASVLSQDETKGQIVGAKRFRSRFNFNR